MVETFIHNIKDTDKPKLNQKFIIFDFTLLRTFKFLKTCFDHFVFGNFGNRNSHLNGI